MATITIKSCTDLPQSKKLTEILPREYVDEDGEGYLGETADNPVDACVEMILKLHELKKLK